jgi:Holliday junction resolvasome RuvABC endonuclease subunit
MILCACDPDTRTPAFALFDGTKLIEWQILKGQIDRLLPEVKYLIDTWHPELLVIENQFLPAMDALRKFRSVSQLVSARAMIMAVFILSGIPYQVIEPFAWQRTLGGAKLGRDQLKHRSILKASDIAREKIENDNIADAINMGFWFAVNNRFPAATIEERVR